MSNDMMSKSKFLSLVLRHRPEAIRVKLDPAGWVDVSTLLEAMKDHGKPLDRAELDTIVATNDKKRFEFNEDGTRIRACQGHSVKDIDLGLEPKEPPDTLYHGTATRFLPSISRKGLIPGNRLYVHLSWDEETATKVGSRHGKPIVLSVAAGRMHRDGFEFFLSNNNVWLTKTVPMAYLSL